jgi:hypothetical protein
MSLFKTIIPVDLEAIKKLLPKESSIDSVKFDPATNSVELHWHARYVTTPHTFATEWPVEMLKHKEFPATATYTPPKTDLSAPTPEPPKPSNRAVRAK